MNDYRYLFGPVPSRRLGRSLGIDLTPLKTCSFDCIFCQLGRTTRKTLDRTEYVPLDDVIKELEDWLARDERADFITLSGSGEPTLHARFGSVLDFVRRSTRIPAALLTNGTTLGNPAIRADAAKAHLVKISLSAWDQASLEHINRPCPEIDFDRLLEGQRLFRQEFTGEVWVEVFLLWGINTDRSTVSAIADLVTTLEPDRVQLNTAVRPPSEDFAIAVPPDILEGLARLFHPPAEVIAEYSPRLSDSIAAGEKEILAMLRRRPCTFEQIAQAFGMHRNEVSKYIGKLARTGQAYAERRDNDVYYVAQQGKAVNHADL
jgi:wyosine [tRNA(Phe)-imidazoG37] synthetase (radical SAM superfamily)